MQNTFVTHRQGYRYGLTQPGAVVTIHMNAVPDRVELEAIDRWLADKLEMDIESETRCACRFDDAEAEKTGAFVWRVLLLGRYLQQTARIPVFDAGLVLGVRRDSEDPSRWRSEVVVPMPDGVSASSTKHVYRSAVQLMALLQKHFNSSELPVTIYHAIQKKILPSLDSGMVVGISTMPILRGAYRHRIPFRHIASGIYQLGWGANSRLVDRSSMESDSIIGAKLSTNKALAAGLLRAAGLPAPEHIPVKNKEQALSAADTLGWPLVVKPADKERGQGVTVSVTDRQKLNAAYKTAASFSRNVLVEREVPGICHRLLVANRKVLYAIRRSPRSVEGDGEHSVAELVDSANARNSEKPPWLQEKPCPVDKQSLDAMSLAGFSPDSVPDKGIRVPLRKIESTAWGGYIEDVSGLVHPENREIAERAVGLFGLRNAGVDIISSDISRPWHENGAIINEINYAPYFGGNEIARSLIPVYLEALMNGDGRIPIEIVVDSDPAAREGRSRQAAFMEKGNGCFLTTHNVTVTPSGEELAFPFESLFNRATALLTNKRVEALILVVQTDEFLKTGLPVDDFDRLTLVDDHIVRWNDPEKRVEPDQLQALLRLLKKETSVNR